MGFLTLLRPADVADPATFAGYAQQTIGTPYPKAREMVVLRTHLKKFFAEEPRANWLTLAHTVDWCRDQHRRPATTWGILSNVRWAWAKGVLPELDPLLPTSGVEQQITDALAIETDITWRRMLIGAVGVDNRRAAYEAWGRRSS